MTPLSEPGKNKWLFPAILTWIACFLVVNTSLAGIIISTGTSMKIISGTTVSCNTDMMLNTGGTLTNEGTIVLKGNLQNQNASLNSLGSGTIQFSGTTQQTISGPNTFGNITINNPNGVTITGSSDNEIDGILTLTSGLLKIGGLNLLMGPAATVAGSPTSTCMVVPTGTGQMRRDFSSLNSFTFPVGDSTGTAAEYSPVTLTFTSGSMPAGSYAGVTLRDSVYNDPNITGDYLSRFWTLSQSGMSGFNCNAQFNYVQADVTGTESGIFCVKVAPNPVVSYSVTNTVSHYLTASGLSSFSTFTGMHGAMTSNAKIMLQGPYSSGSMTTSLTALPLGARTDPTKFPNQQPYNGSPWNYSGTESISSIPSGTVDWVLVTLRKGTAPGTATFLARRAGLLKSDGTITDTDGTSPLKFYDAPVGAGEKVYVFINHRNHMPVLSYTEALKNGSTGIFEYDFTTGSAKFYPNTGAGCVQLSSSPVIWGMLAGDANNDGSIFLNDQNTYWVPTAGSTTQYLVGDFNMDTNAFLNDINSYWVPNAGLTNVLP